MTERRTLGDLDFEYELDHPYDDDGWFGRALIAEPVSTPDAVDLRLDAPVDELRHDADDLDGDDTDQWYMPPAADESTADEPVSTHVVQDPQRDVTPWTGVLAPRNGATVAATTESWQSKLSNSGAWDFKVSAPAPVVPLQATGRRVRRSGGRGDRRDGHPGVDARSRRRGVGVADQLHRLRAPKPAEPRPRCPAHLLHRRLRFHRHRHRRRPRPKRSPVPPPPGPTPAEAVRSVAVGHAGDRGDPHTRHTGADERDAAAAAGSRPELVDTGRRPQARLGTLVIVQSSRGVSGPWS